MQEKIVSYILSVLNVFLSFDYQASIVRFRLMPVMFGNDCCYRNPLRIRMGYRDFPKQSDNKTVFILPSSKNLASEV